MQYRSQPAARTAPRQPRYPQTQRILKSKTALGIVLGLALLLLGGVLTVGPRSSHGVRYVPSTRSIASGRVVVNPRDGLAYRIEITPEMHHAQIIGNFTAYGGATNSVEAVVMRAADYATWVEGNDSFAYYSSGQKAADQFAVRLDPGTYAFAISNRISKSAAKFVFLDVDLIYDRRETE